MPEAFSLDKTATYLPLILEIRRRLLFLTSLFLAASLLGFIFYEKIIRLILSVFQFSGVNIVFTSPFQYINLAINSSLLLGLTVIFPIITLQVLAFLKPALHPKEYRAVMVLLPISLVLFLAGFSYGVLIMKYTIELFYQQSQNLGVGNLLDISNFFSQTLITAILLGVAFLFPLVLTFLMRFQVIDHPFLTKQRPIVYLVSLVFVVFLPPNDLFTDALLVLPLAFLFELTLILNRVIFRSTHRKEKKNV